jgi:mannose-6-phosphate isomerase-like protein (cupin superfamily)
MDYIRTTKEAAFEPTGFPGYTIQMLAYPEAATFINSRVESGGHAADLHVHETDQLYYVVEGEMQVELGHDRYTAGADTLVHIPAGLPHRNWNQGPETEFHFEIIVPSARPGKALLRLVESASSAPDQSPGYVAAAAPASGEAMTLQTLTRESAGFVRPVVSVCDEPAHSAGSDVHTHEFDQFYYVLRGGLSVQVAGAEHEVLERTLVILPSGVPHRSWNPGELDCRYLVVNLSKPPLARD